MNYWFELKYTLRLMRNKLSFTSLCILVIALGIGISIPLLSMTRFLGLQDLQVENGERMVVLKKTILGQQNNSFTDAFIYRRLQQSDHSFEHIGAFESFSAILSDGDSAETFNAARIVPDTLGLIPANPLLGRALQASDDIPGANPVAVIGYTLWQSYYAGQQDIVGQQSRINGEPYTIVGVMPEGFTFPITHNIWLPFQLGANPEPGENSRLSIVGLLKEGVSPNSAAVEFNALLASLGEELPDFYSGMVGVVMSYPLITMNDGPIFGQLIVGMVIIILLLVCFNVTNLLTVRSTERISELAVRSALGGTRWRIMRQILLESLLICIVAAVIGLIIGALALAGIRSLVASFPGAIAFWITFDLQLNDIVSLLAMTLCIWLVSGLYPAWQVSRRDISGVLSSDSGSIAGGAAGRLTRLLVTLEIIGSSFLLIIGMYFVIGTYAASHIDMGIESEGFLSAKIDLSSSNYSDPASKVRFLQDVGRELQSSDQFEEVTFATALAGQFPPRMAYSLEDRDISIESRYPQVGLVWSSANYADLMKIDVLSGRYFDFNDSVNSLPVVVIDEILAERFWPGEASQSALGKRIQLEPNQPGEWLTVVGVINHLIQGQPTAERLYQSTVYRPIAQLPLASESVQARVGSISLAVAAPSLLLKPMGEYEQLLKTVTAGIDRDVPVSDVMPLSRAIYLIMEAVGLTNDVMVYISLITLFLAVIGIYGVISRSVLSRGKEIGIRRALGSSNFRIIKIFLKQGTTFLLFGALIGGVGGVLVVNGVASAVGSQGTNYGFILAVIVPVLSSLALLVFVASYVPARRLVSIEPGEALHYE